MVEYISLSLYCPKIHTQSKLLTGHQFRQEKEEGLLAPLFHPSGLHFFYETATLCVTPSFLRSYRGSCSISGLYAELH